MAVGGGLLLVLLIGFDCVDCGQDGVYSVVGVGPPQHMDYALQRLFFLCIVWLVCFVQFRILGGGGRIMLWRL